MKSLLSALTFALVLCVLGGKAYASPTCVDSMMAGLFSGSGCSGTAFRLVKLVIHRKDNSWVSYSAGTMSSFGSGNAQTGNISQLFSDRQSSGQPFDKNNADTHNLNVRASDGLITITNATWGFTTTLSSPTCNGNLIVASDSGSQYTISWGGLQCL